jgi:hypothetical protein
MQLCKSLALNASYYLARTFLFIKLAGGAQKVIAEQSSG